MLNTLTARLPTLTTARTMTWLLMRWAVSIWGVNSNPNWVDPPNIKVAMCSPRPQLGQDVAQRLCTGIFLSRVMVRLDPSDRAPTLQL